MDSVLSYLSPMDSGCSFVIFHVLNVDPRVDFWTCWKTSV